MAHYNSFFFPLRNRYSGNDLKNAGCYDRNGLAPYSATVHSMIGAMVSKIKEIGMFQGLMI